MLISINPATGEAIAQYPLHDPAHVDTVLDAAARAQARWRALPIEARCAGMRRAGELLRQRKKAYARLITLEMGKPLSEALAEIEKSAWTCDHYADHAPRLLADEPVPANGSYSAVTYDPLGVVLAIMPWNYPFWQFVRFAAPTLCAGNGAVLKHAGNVPQCALALEELFRDAIDMPGLVGNVFIEPERVAALIDDSRIAAVTLTGSTAVGKLVAAQAGRAMKKQVLELGGSDPFIVLADADVERAAAAAAKARFSNTGQSCISAKRFIVDGRVADEFSARLCAHAGALAMGDPLQAGTGLGPMARANLRTALHDQVERSLAQGAELKLGGRMPDGPGFFYPATVLDHVTPAMAAGCEETFGPVAAVMRVRDTEAAIALANATEFGLGAALWTGNVDGARELARGIDAGAVFVNGIVASDARLPFGGIKQSGYGRELGAAGIREFTNIKTYWVGPAT
ncbi:NAD-dependent succinate-semialdehyde dehydrogenase [Pigmentiphaga sp. H8]|uniref:NAD-dependent succinate-semialdehyde dehydrogenase n=1 Tax=Pigmentiphaga sp. H8 TaxID=2488560 RepID=UPI000F5B6478|nr:NAD-dependent succinate-semialdehyde dehydrogenase [Pigmentiphaga sp. H8]AZG11203.1 NAD-dependent succinate-semialdehyde dehydrogenase [Pigmentiphaga sp. H8]